MATKMCEEPKDAEKVVHVNLVDAAGGKQRQNVKMKQCVIRVTELGIGIHFAGYGDKCSDDGCGEPIYIEFYDGAPRVYVWGDINQEDPTQKISLAGAALKLRKDAIDEDATVRG
jgi:hypothetical protein